MEAGPVEPKQLPSGLTQMTWKISVSMGLPGPIMNSHQPGVGPCTDDAACPTLAHTEKTRLDELLPGGRPAVIVTGIDDPRYRAGHDVAGPGWIAERQRVARDLHDSVTQSLYGATLYADGPTMPLVFDVSATDDVGIASVSVIGDRAHNPRWRRSDRVRPYHVRIREVEHGARDWTVRVRDRQGNVTESKVRIDVRQRPAASP